MQSFHKNKRKKNIFIYIILIIVFIIINPFNIFGSVRNMIMVPMSPILQSGFGAGSRFSEYVGVVLNIGTLYKENQQLNITVKNLEAKNAFMEDVKNENKKLRNELDLLPRDEFNLTGADIILRDSVGGNQWILINKGEKDGVAIGNPVLVGEGNLIGVIDEINENTSHVKLVTHPDSLINIVTSRTGAEGLACGNHGLSIIVEDIKKESDIVEGDTFVTSDIGGILPRGLNVGVTQNVEIAEDDLFFKATVAPSVILENVNHVFIVK